MRARQQGLIAGAATALFLVLGGAAVAQQGTLVGTVTDAEELGGPVSQAAVNVSGEGQSRTVLANEQGRYTVQLPAGTYFLVVERLNYRTERFGPVTVSAGQSTTYDVRLTSEALALDGLNVTVGRSQIGQKSTESPATVSNVTSLEISERPTPNMADHLRGATGVDVVTHGLQASNVVVRGFNNIFSGALHLLTDHRLAGVPSLRVNLMHFIPTTDEDIDRMEVVLGPGSALYGPNTANGVVHILTKSPLESQGTSVTLGAGERAVFQGSFRSAFLLNQDFGFKLSGQYLRGDEWEYVDPAEEAGRLDNIANPGACQTDKIVRGLTAAEALAACNRIGDRDFGIERWGMEARADYRFADDGTIVATYGRNTSSGVELTGLGAGQTQDWVYQYFQSRVSKERFFAQAYYNTSDAGGSFLLQDGVPLVDESTLFVGQVQHGVAVAEGREELTYGFDYFSTRPNSGGTIYGSYETDDDINEWGLYLQSKTAVSDQFDFIVAGRVDSHSILPSNVFSPRAAVVYKPREGQNFRFSYNSAFSTPTALNYFLDISGGVAPPPLGGLGYSSRAFGSGRNGWSLQDADGSLHGMRSPFNPGGAGQLLPADVPVMWQLAVGVLLAQGAIGAQTAALLGSLTPTNSDITRLMLDPTSQVITPVTGAKVLPDIESTLESNTETFEVGWTGLVNDRLKITADVYRMKKNDFISPLLVQTPLLLLNGPDIAAYLTPFVGAPTAGALAAGMAQVPLGVVSSDQVGAQGADLIVSYRNVGDITLWGGDLAFEAFLTNQWTLAGTFSYVDKDWFEITGGAPISLNAPAQKGSLSLAYRNVVAGFNGSLRVRVTSSFPVESAVYSGTACITGGGGLFEEPCVDDFAIFDLGLGYRVPNSPATVQLMVNNLLGTPYRSFVGVPKIGRFAMVRVRYELF